MKNILIILLIVLTTASISGQHTELVDTLPELIIVDTINVEGYLYDIECEKSSSSIRLFSINDHVKPTVNVILQEGGAVYLHPEIFIEFLYDHLDSAEFISSMNTYEAVLPNKPMNVIDVTKNKKYKVSYVKDRFVIGLISAKTYLSSFSHVCNLKGVYGYIPVIMLYRESK